MIHHDFRKGQRIYVICRNGYTFTDKFVARHSKTLEFESMGRVALDVIRSTTILRRKATA